VKSLNRCRCDTWERRKRVPENGKKDDLVVQSPKNKGLVASKRKIRKTTNLRSCAAEREEGRTGREARDDNISGGDERKDAGAGRRLIPRTGRKEKRELIGAGKRRAAYPEKVHKGTEGSSGVSK